jgi:hypothetical protein
VDLDLIGKRHDDPVPGYALRLRPLRRICAALLGAVALFGFLSWLLVSQAGAAVAGAPPALPLSLSFFAAMLILFSSRFRWTILRRVFPRSAALPVDPEAVLAAYGKGTLISFAILETAALVGLLVALTSGSPTYGVLLCFICAVAMATRWPRGSEVDRIVRGRLR